MDFSSSGPQHREQGRELSRRKGARQGDLQQKEPKKVSSREPSGAGSPHRSPVGSLPQHSIKSPAQSRAQRTQQKLRREV